MVTSFRSSRHYHRRYRYDIYIYCNTLQLFRIVSLLDSYISILLRSVLEIVFRNQFLLLKFVSRLNTQKLKMDRNFFKLAIIEYKIHFDEYQGY